MATQLRQGTYTVERKSLCRYLGAIIDGPLYRNGHRNYLDGKATKKLAVLRTMRRLNMVLGTSGLEAPLRYYLLPTMMYGSSVWHIPNLGFGKTVLQKKAHTLIRIQRRAAHMISCTVDLGLFLLSIRRHLDAALDATLLRSAVLLIYDLSLHQGSLPPPTYP